MTKLDEGRLMAYLDGELTAAEAADVESLAQEDQATRQALEELGRRAGTVADLLAHLDADPPTSRVRDALSGREARRSAGIGRPRPFFLRASWAQAAALVVLFAGAGAAAMPGSPVRAFLSGVLANDEERATGRSAAPAALTEEVGVRVASDEGRLEVVLRDVPLGTPVSVALVDGDLAAVYAPAGSRFESGDGWIEASVVASDGSETVRVEIPRSLSRASLEVNGRMYLVKDGDRLDLTGPSSHSTATEIRFLTG